MNWRRRVEEQPVWRVLAAWLLMAFLLGVLLLLTACAPVGGDDGPEARESPTRRLDGPGTDACTQFARWQADGADPDTRAEIARSVHRAASNSNSGDVDGRAEVLFRVRDQGRSETWALAADSFAAECLRLGWTPGDR